MIYHVEFKLNGKTQSQTFEGHDVGNAFAKCLKKHPGCSLKGAFCQGRYRSGEKIWIDYTVPSTRGPEPLPQENMSQDEMFTDDPRRPKPKKAKKAGKAGKITE